MTTATEAFECYNRLFDNQQYSALADRLTTDLRTERESVRTSDAINLVTDTALMLARHPHYTDAWLKLAVYCGQNTITLPTVDAIYTYLLIFQQQGDTRADDFESTAKALLKAYEVSDTLRAAVSYANGVHGWQGRMAYDSLSAADYLTQAALHLLMHGNVSYIGEKLQQGLCRIIRALYEGIRHNERPGLFDFCSTCFPSEQDRS